MRQRFALVAIEQNDVAGFGLLLAQLQAQADALDLVGDLAPFQRVSRPPVTELFFRNAFDNCERLMRTPSRASISARMRAIVQFGRLATGSSRSGATTRKAVHFLPVTGRVPRSPSTPRCHRGRNRCATAAPCLRAPRERNRYRECH